MNPIRVVAGTGVGPTELSAHDAALAAAGVHDYNLVCLSSVVPAGAEVRVVGTAPDLGAVGDRLPVVIADAAATERVGVALSWARGPDGRGIFYEASATGSDARDRARQVATDGLAAGVDLREWSAVERTVETVAASPADTGPGEFAGAVVLATFGDGESIL